MPFIGKVPPPTNDTRPPAHIQIRRHSQCRTHAALVGIFSDVGHAGLLAATAPRLPNVYTVIGVWQDDEPIPVGVIAGEHPVHDGDERAFPHGLWATSVTAPDSTTAQRLGIAEMRQS